MKRVVITGKETIELTDLIPEPLGENDVAIKVEACGICGSDINFFKTGGLVPEMEGIPLNIGHEFSGSVSEIGANALGISVGDRVVVNPATGGNIGFGGSEGAFSPRVVVKNALYGYNLFKLPDSIPFHLGALTEPLNVGWQAVERSNVKAGQKIFISGAGPIGLCVLVCLVHLGHKNVVISDLSNYRLELAKQLGAKTTINAGKEDVWDTLIQLHGESDFFGQKLLGTDVIIEASGAPIIDQIINKAKYSSQITFVAASHKPVNIYFDLIQSKQLTICGSQMYGKDFSAPIELLQNMDLTPMISHRFPLTNFNDALNTLMNGSEVAKVIIDTV